MTVVDITLCPVQEREQWDGYVKAHPNGGPYHFYGWMAAVKRAYGFAYLPFALWRNGTLAGVLPVVRHSVPSRKPVLVSLPFCDYGGALANTEKDAVLLREHVLTYAASRGFAAELRAPVLQQPPGEYPPHTSVHKVLMRLPFPASTESLSVSDVLWKSFKSKLRSQVQRPLRADLAVSKGGVELLDGFYRVYVRNMRDLGSPPHSRKWFQSVLEELGDKAKIFLVCLPDGTVTGGSVLLMHQHVGTVPWASTVREWNNLSPNMLLYWSMLKFCADSGCREFDFGRSTPQEGTYRFKAQWGAMPVPLLWQQATPYMELTGLEGGSPSSARKLIASCWKKFPVPVSTFAGSLLRRYISL